jgi:hypothetical protein
MRDALNFENLKEELSALEHERWAHWQKYLHGKCVANIDGSLTIPKHLVEKWARQINTPYAELNEAEKDSDRSQVEKYFPILKAYMIKNQPS